MSNEQNLLTFDEAVSFLRVKKSWLRAATFQRKIPFLKLNHLVRFERSELLNWLKNCKKEVRQ